jgi:NADPH:quinone reductase-like Zn-dependent oxidoreductase
LRCRWHSDGALGAFKFFTDAGNIQSGQRALINAWVQSARAVQLAKYFGAHVTGVCSTAMWNSEIFVDHIVDYTKDDFTKNSETYDFIFDAVGKSSAVVRICSHSRSHVTTSPTGFSP